MPITLPPISRRRFLAGSLAAGAGLLAGRSAFAADAAADPNRFALLSDTHVSGEAGQMARGVDMAANLRQTAAEILKRNRRPAAVLVDGDCAYLQGKADDYAALVGLLEPLREAGLPIHLALGNHDHREHFHAALPPRGGEDNLVDRRHISVVPSPNATWIQLDSLDATNSTPGRLGREQLDWLARELDAHADRPTLVMVHHQPDERPEPSGLVETKELLDTLLPRKQVKALFFGHTHDFSIEQREGMQLVNLPPTAYVFQEGKPNGWIDMQVTPRGAMLELRCLDPAHPQHGKLFELNWRV